VKNRLRVLFFVEGFTDIRFVVGLSQVWDLTLAVPAQPYAASGLKTRVAQAAPTWWWRRSAAGGWRSRSARGGTSGGERRTST